MSLIPSPEPSILAFNKCLELKFKMSEDAHSRGHGTRWRDLKRQNYSGERDGDQVVCSVIFLTQTPVMVLLKYILCLEDS